MYRKALGGATPLFRSAIRGLRGVSSRISENTLAMTAPKGMAMARMAVKGSSPMTFTKNKPQMISWMPRGTARAERVISHGARRRRRRPPSCLLGKSDSHHASEARIPPRKPKITLKKVPHTAKASVVRVASSVRRRNSGLSSGRRPARKKRATSVHPPSLTRSRRKSPAW